MVLFYAAHMRALITLCVRVGTAFKHIVNNLCDRADLSVYDIIDSRCVIIFISRFSNRNESSLSGASYLYFYLKILITYA